MAKGTGLTGAQGSCIVVQGFCNIEHLLCKRNSSCCRSWCCRSCPSTVSFTELLVWGRKDGPGHGDGQEEGAPPPRISDTNKPAVWCDWLCLHLRGWCHLPHT